MEQQLEIPELPAISRDKARRVVTPVVLCKSSARASRRAVGAARVDVIVLSPYLTSTTAEAVVSAADPKTALVITTFKAENFATGSSRLGTIKKLIGLGFKVNELEGLHAKLILAGNVVHVGSQNLTAGGTHNKEVTAILTDTVLTKQVRRDICAWILASTPITLEMVADMERDLVSIRMLARQFAEKAQEVDNKIRRLAAERKRLRVEQDRLAEEKERRRQEDAHRRRSDKAYHALRQTVSQAQPIGEPVRLTLLREHHPPTLMAPLGVDLTQWPTKGNPQIGDVERRHRYLTIVPETGQLTWPAWNKTRLTQFGTGMMDKEFLFDGQLTRLEISSNMNHESLPDWNVRFRFGTLTPEENMALYARFTLSGFTIHKHGEGLNGLIRNRSHRKNLLVALKEQLLKPFRYEQNRYGIKADEFCDSMPMQPEHLLIHPLRYERRLFFALGCESL
jgi:hypothetical protein